jgi:glycosyltransferase involved in cell wall biosynthesis
MQQKKILCLFDYNSFTGFAQVSKNLIANWKETFKEKVFFDIVAINYFGDDYVEGENTRIISAKKKDIGSDDFGRHVFLATLYRGDYDAVFIMQDLGVIVPIIKHLHEIKEKRGAEGKKSFKSFFYFPVDFELNANLVKGLSFFDEIYTYTEYGRGRVARWNWSLKDKVKVVPHGNNPNDFYQHTWWMTTDDFRKEYYGEENAKKFIVGCVNRNQSRKDIPNTIMGFNEYHEKYDTDCFLYLHMNPNDPMGWNLKVICDQLGMKEGINYMFPSVKDYNEGVDLKKLNNIYNSFDLFLSTATGEGWGLTITEAMATKTPVIAPNHTSIAEIGDKGNRIFLLEKLSPVVHMADNIIRFQTDIDEIADKIKEVRDFIKEAEESENCNELDDKIEKAWKYVRGLEWKYISKIFSDDFSKHLKLKATNK